MSTMTFEDRLKVFPEPDLSAGSLCGRCHITCHECLYLLRYIKVTCSETGLAQRPSVLTGPNGNNDCSNYPSRRTWVKTSPRGAIHSDRE